MIPDKLKNHCWVFFLVFFKLTKKNYLKNTLSGLRACYRRGGESRQAKLIHF